MDAVSERPRTAPTDTAESVTALAALASQIAHASLSVLIGVPGDDVHVVANKLAETILASVGYAVTNLGVLVPAAELVAAARDLRPSAILLSSLNGHALLNCGSVPRLLAEAGEEVPVYVGGNLCVGRTDWPLVLRRFAGLGFARVFPPRTDLLAGVAEISRELLQPRVVHAIRRSGAPA